MEESVNPFADPTSVSRGNSRFTTFSLPDSSVHDDSPSGAPVNSTQPIGEKLTKFGRSPHFATKSRSKKRRPHQKPDDQHYDDFETIDWVKDIARDRDRHRRIHSSKASY
ncbi:hypothetical protein SprV_0100369000 [Sparganum proliferum]